MMAGAPVQEVVHHDKCKRLSPTYNANYNPYKEPPDGINKGYSPYVYREPLWDDRPVVITRILKGLVVIGPPKKHEPRGFGN